MEKARQVKILSIVALVLAIAGMTLGFAAFSTTLSISSSATVTPSSDDFKITIYGVEDEDMLAGFVNNGYESLELSSVRGNSICSSSSVERTLATIDNTNHTISNISVNFKNEVAQVIYLFMLKNEGKYDAYLDLSNMNFMNGKYNLYEMVNKTCVADVGTSEDLVKEACNGLELSFGIFDDEKMTYKSIDSDHLLIPVDGYEIFAYSLHYKGPYADGPFDVNIDDFQLKFSTTK